MGQERERYNDETDSSRHDPGLHPGGSTGADRLHEQQFRREQRLAEPQHERHGLSVLTEMTEQDKNGKLNTITAAVVLDGEGRIRDVQLDELELTVTADDTGKVDLPSDHRTKRQKGEDYPLAAVSSLKAGWAEQVDAFGRWLTGKTADQVRGLELDTDGKAQDADLLSGCTIAVENYRNAVLRACADAREMR